MTSRQSAGRSVAQVFPRFAGHSRSRTLQFTTPAPEELGKEADIAFLALPHGVASEFAVQLVKAGVKVIDLSADFRLRSAETYREFYAHEHPAPEHVPGAEMAKVVAPSGAGCSGLGASCWQAASESDARSSAAARTVDVMPCTGAKEGGRRA